MSIELLESRIAPASILTFIDVDGDKVKIVSSHGDLTGKATFADIGLGQQLQRLDLSDAAFAGANIKTIVTKSSTGDGLVNIGRLSALNRDLGSISINGDLGCLICGDGDSKTGPGLKSLNARSMGVFGTATQGASPSLRSSIEGAIGSIKVSGDLRDVTLGAEDFSNQAGGSIGSITIGGSLIGFNVARGSIFSTGDIGLLKIGGDVVGGPEVLAGSIGCGGTLHSLLIGGSVIGGQGIFSADISAAEFGAIKIRGDIRGGLGGPSAVLHSADGIGSLFVGGSIVGGTGAAMFTDGIHQFFGQVIALGDIGSVTVKHDVHGAGGLGSGSIQSFGNIGSITIGGSLLAGSGNESGKIDVAGSLTSLKIGGSVIGGDGNQQTMIVDGLRHDGQVFVGADLGTVHVGRDVLGGFGSSSGRIQSNGKIGSVTIGGSLVGLGGQSSGAVVCVQDITQVKIGGSLAGGSSLFSGSIFVGGNVGAMAITGSVLGGQGGHSGEISIGGGLGALKIGGNLQGGDLRDKQVSLNGSGYIHADRIGSVFIGGSVITGTDASDNGALDHNASIRALHELGSIIVRGSLVGNNAAQGFTPVVISAAGLGSTLPAEATTDLAIKSLTVQGRVEFAKVLGGFTPDDFEDLGSNGNASIGPVKVGGSWTASSISAGVQDRGPLGFGTDGDSVIDSPTGAASDAIIARIASVTIKGAVAGDPNLPFHSGFIAQQIGSFKSAGFSPKLTPGPDGTIVFTAIATNETIREV